MSTERYERLLQVDPDIIVWDLRKGIPFPEGTFDVVYHSHFLEHIDREAAPSLLDECYRVLKPQGVLRVAIPDLQQAIERYQTSLTRVERDRADAEALREHGESVLGIFEQFVRREATGTQQQRPLVRRVERLFRGDAAKTGEVHRWMYDEHTLRALVETVGFTEVRTESASTSRVPGWDNFYLDINQDGSVYKPASLYMEAAKEPEGRGQTSRRSRSTDKRA